MLSHSHTAELFKRVINNKQASTLKPLFLVKMPTIEAFARHIFDSALLIQDMNFVKFFIDAGTNVNLHTPLGDMPISIARRTRQHSAS
jgi:hypothetical protein